MDGDSQIAPKLGARVSGHLGKEFTMATFVQL
jgi:hypothetical protein